MEYLAKDLQPGVTYAVQIRSTSGDDTSEWSPIFLVTTTSDGTLPQNVAGLSGSIIGSSFKIIWTKITRNTDNSAIRDLKDYEITITDGTTTVTRYALTNSFLYSITQNQEDFGSPQPSLTFTVKGRDTTNNLSPVAASVTLNNPVPGVVSGVVVTPLTESIAVSWNPLADTDIQYYNVYADTSSGFVAGPSNLVFSAKATSFNFPGTPGTTYYFQVTGVDVFNQESSAPGTGNTSPSAIPTNDHDTHVFTYTGPVALLTGTARLYFESAYTILSVRASVGTAPTGSSLKVDVKKNGTTLWNVTPANKPAITASSFTSGAVTNMDTTTIGAGDYLTVDITQVGSTIPGSDLTVTIRVSA